MKNKLLSFLYLATVTLVFLCGDTAAQKNTPPKTEDALAAVEILEKHVEALGGAAAFAAIKSIEIQVERAVLGRTIKVRRIDDVAGKRSYNRQDGGNGVIETGFDGQKAWQKAPFFRGYLEATNPQAKALMLGGVRLSGAALYDYKTDDKKFARLPDEQIGGKNYFVLKSSYTDEAGKETVVKYFFDTATYLLKQIVSGSAVTQTETFDDYRKIGGLTVAFATSIVNPQVTINSKIIDLKFNQPIDAAVFEFRETAAQQTTVAMTSATTAAKNASAVESIGDKTADEISESARLQTFETVWKKINDTFYDRTFNGVNWQSVHAKYLPLVKTTPKSEDYHRLLNQMVQELRLSHFKVNAPQNIVTLSSGAANLKNGSTGLSFKWIESQLIVSDVKKDSPAALAAIKKGFVVARINEKTPDELYAEYRKINPGFQLREELARVRAAASELAGKPDSKIRLEVADADGNPKKLELVRTATAPGRQLEFESKKLAGNVGYVRFNFFFGDLLPKFQAALSELRDTKALIIDLRGNAGGAGDLAPAMANLLSAAPGSLGSLKYRYETTEYSYAGSGERAYRGKIVLLTDEGTGSTAEVFAGGLQANKRATVVGSRSAGAVLPSLAELLPTGGALQYVVSNYKTPDGTTLEGRGIKPDIEVETSRQNLLAERDPVLERAIEFVGK